MTTRVFRRVLPWLLMLVTVLALAGDEKLRLAIMEVEDTTGLFRPKALQTATDLLRTLLTQSGKYLIIDKGQQEKELKEVLKAQKKESRKECYDKSCQIELGQALSADTLLRSQISKLGKSCTLSSEMIDIGKEAGIGSGVSKFDCTEDGLATAIEEVAAQVMGDVRETRKSEKAAAGCAKDADCKGERVCEEGKCVEPKKADQGSETKKTEAAKSGLNASGETWTDPQSGLMWQVTPANKAMKWEDAESYCWKLNLGGYSDWHLPDRQELESLRRNEKSNGCYWPVEMKGACSSYWSSSLGEDRDGKAWYVNFRYGNVNDYGVYNDDHARCVRGGP